MSISPVSNASSFHQAPAAQTQAPKAAPQPAADTVHLSQAAQAKSGDVDHDGDRH